MRFYLNSGLIIIYLLGCIGSVHAQVKELDENKIQENGSKVIGIDSNESPVDSVYHAGALLFMDLGMDYNTLKSTFCLSCHDGAFTSGGHSNTNFGNPPNVSKMAAVLNFDHPVAFDYTKELALSNPSLKDPSSYSPMLSGTIAEILLVDGRVECVTCHNIFFKTGKRKRNDILNENVGTLLCLECHSIR